MVSGLVLCIDCTFVQFTRYHSLACFPQLEWLIVLINSEICSLYAPFYDICQVCFHITMEFCHVIPNETLSSIAIGKSVTKRFFSIVENTVIFWHCLVFVHVVNISSSYCNITIKRDQYSSPFYSILARDSQAITSQYPTNSNSWVGCEDISFVVEVDGCYAQAFPIDVARAVRRFKETHCVQSYFEIWTCSHKETAALRLIGSFPLKPDPD